MAAIHPISPAAAQRAEVKAKAKTGEAAAALIAGGVGCFVIGLMTTLAEIKALEWFKLDVLQLNAAVGPLSGKTIFGVVAFLIAWAIAHFQLRNRDVDLKRSVVIAAVLLFLGLLGTFPPVFQAFGG